MVWQDKISVKKGTTAEELVHARLERLGFTVYRPETEGPHLIDILAIKGAGPQMIAVDVKAKARRTYYPDTGINIRVYKRYLALGEKHDISIMLVFVDEYLRRIYGNWLNELSRPVKIAVGEKIIEYPLYSGGIIYFPLASMIVLGEIEAGKVAELSRLSVRSYEYANNEENMLVKGRDDANI